MVEKKVILCAILAIALGIATIVPVEYLMTAQAQANAQTADAQAKANATADVQASVQPMISDVNVTSAYCNPDKTISNDTGTFYGAEIEADVNFTLNPNVLTHEAFQIECYQFAVSSDQGPIVNMTYFLAGSEQNATFYISPNGIAFANGLTYGPVPNMEGQGISLGVWNSSSPIVPQPGLLTYVTDTIFGSDPNNLPQAATELANAQTLYIDVSKISTVTVSGNVTVTTPASNQVLQHIVLTKIGNEFVYGTLPPYANGTLPFPINGTFPITLPFPTETP